MMDLQISKQTYGNAAVSANGNTVYLQGEIDARDTEKFLTPFFKKINEAVDGDLHIDLKSLDFINSAGIKCLISFILNRKKGIKVTFLVDQNKTWQQDALEIIKSLDENNIYFKV